MNYTENVFFFPIHFGINTRFALSMPFWVTGDSLCIKLT